MVLKIYGHPMSACTRRVVLVAQELRIPWELVKVDFTAGEHKLPAFVEKSPFGQIPIIEDDGLRIFDSRAIGRYLASKYGPNSPIALILRPDDLAALAAFEEGMAVEEMSFEPYACAAAHEKILVPIMGGKTDEVKLSEHLAMLESKLDAYEVILSKRPYIGGSTLSLADLNHLPYGIVMAQAGMRVLEDEKRPHVKKWWREISGRKAWAEGLAALSRY